MSASSACNDMPELEVVETAGIAMVQDGGRPGHMHEGVPIGGALVPDLLSRANRAVGNDDGAAGIEIFGRIRLAARGGFVSAATDDGTVVRLAPGTDLAVRPAPRFRVGYVAVRGGVDVPVILGGRGTYPLGGFGGLDGRALRRGDRLPIGVLAEAPHAAPGEPLALTAPIRMVVGPDETRFEPSAMQTLTASAFTVDAASDRMGTRLEGAALSRRDADDTRSVPMAPGAIQVPASGKPIVLGPDHPTIGGYPVIAVVIAADRGLFAARPIGAQVRFRQVTLDEARAAFRGR
jgi:biotin-dependent carboxylase-like uncharacterized protein